MLTINPLWSASLADQSGIRFSLWAYFLCITWGKMTELDCIHEKNHNTPSEWTCIHIDTLQAGPFPISSQSTSWQLSVKSENYEQNSQLSEHALSETISHWCGAVCWHVNWCFWPPKLGGHRILVDNIDFDIVLILIKTFVQYMYMDIPKCRGIDATK